MEIGGLHIEKYKDNYYVVGGRGFYFGFRDRIMAPSKFNILYYYDEELFRDALFWEIPDKAWDFKGFGRKKRVEAVYCEDGELGTIDVYVDKYILEHPKELEPF